MTKKNLSALTTMLLIGAIPRIGISDPGLVRTTYALDDARGYCLDIRGFGQNIQLDAPLQVHTCKYGAALSDQVFEQPAGSAMLRVVEYDRCLAVAAHEPGAELLVRACEDASLQRWDFAWGRLTPEARPDLCVSLAGDTGEPAGTPAMITPVYRHQSVALQPCADDLLGRQSLRWSPPEERALSSANVARRGMPESIAAELDGFGRAFNGEVISGTAQMFASVERVYNSSEIEVVRNIAYGPDELQQFDIHTGVGRRSGQGVPSIVVFHGGGLIGGSRDTTANVADYFASLGLIGVNGTYRRAPDHKWPEGGRDIGAAVTWLHENVAEYGGDPDQVFVMGLSTGAFHSATYVFRPELMPEGTARAAGAMLLSGPYTFDFENPSRGELAYFGEDPSLYAARVVVGNVTGTDIPTLLATAEWDVERYTRAFAALLEELVTEHGVMPRYKQSLGHNHTSQVLSIGSADTGLSSELVDFIHRTVEGK